MEISCWHCNLLCFDGLFCKVGCIVGVGLLWVWFRVGNVLVVVCLVIFNSGVMLLCVDVL